MTSPAPLLYGWQIRVLIATGVGMTLAFMLGIIQPSEYVARSYVRVGSEEQMEPTLSYTRSLGFSGLVARELNVLPGELAAATDFGANRIGGWISIEAHHTESLGAASVANETAQLLIAEATAGELSMLVSAEPPLSPVSVVPQGLALVAGALALGVALLVEVTVARTPATGVVRTAAHASSLAGAPALSAPHRITVWFDQERPDLARHLPRILNPDGEAPRILVAASSRPDAFAIGEIVRDALQSHDMPIRGYEAAIGQPEVTAADLTDVGGVVVTDVGGVVVVLPTLDALEVRQWAALTTRVVLGVRAGETAAFAVRAAARSLHSVERDVDAVIIDSSRRQRRRADPAEAEWAVMD